MALFYPAPHTLAPAPSHRVRAEWVRRVVGAVLVFYLMPLILAVLAIGAFGVVVERGRRRLRSPG
jgi:nitrate reductase NapE component